MSGIDSGLIDQGNIDDDGVITLGATGNLDGGGTWSGFAYQHLVDLADHPEVDPTDTLDCVDAVQAIIDAADPGTLIQFEDGGTYKWDGINRDIASNGPPTLTSASYIFLNGNGATLHTHTAGPFATTRTDNNSIQHIQNLNLHRTFFTTVKGAHLRFWGFNFAGANAAGGTGLTAYKAAYESQHCFDVQGTDDIQMWANSASFWYGDFACLAPDVGTHRDSSNVQITDNNYRNNGRQGITLNGCTDVKILRNTAQNIRHAHFDLEPNFTSAATKPKIQRVLIDDNDFGFNKLNFFAAGNNQPATISDIVVSANRMPNCWFWCEITGPATVGRRQRISFINNVSSLSYGAPDPAPWEMGISNWDGVVVYGNTFTLQSPRSPVMTAVHTANCTGVDVRGNLHPGGNEFTSTGTGPTTINATGTLIGGGVWLGAGTKLPPTLGTGFLPGGGIWTGSGTTVNDATGELDGGGVWLGFGVGFSAGNSGDGTLDGGGTWVGTGETVVAATGTLDGGGAWVGAGTTRRHGRRGISVGPIWLRGPGFGKGKFGDGPFGGL